jgi:hypothetical protein
MNRTIRVAVVSIISFAGLQGLWAQEVITPLYWNPRAAQIHGEQVQIRKAAEASLLELPLFDDFSNTFLVADTGSWSDAYAFINNNFCFKPVSNGVATLDALDADGSIYAHATLSPTTFVADHLTSKTINLQYPASDSLYLSFLYQAGGLCDLPEEEDSLMVDFYATDSSQWINVWRIPGRSLHEFSHAMIPISSERFLTSGFRFRFRNRASLSRSNDYPDKRSNVDYWHVDYVRLDRNRTSSDTILRDVAFYTPLRSVLKELSSVPWSHFEVAYNTTINSFVSARYRNHDSITRNVTRSLTILEPIYNESYNPGTPTAQDLPEHDDTIVDLSFIYPFDFQRGDSALIRFKAALRTDAFDPKVNDTVIHDQWFKDYYSYDDGTAEAGYGLRASGTANALVAMKYNSFKPDQLGGVYVYFNQVYDSVNLKNYSFNLMVWDQIDGLPGNVIHEDANSFKPIYTSTYTGFIRYEFSEPVPVSGPFFVGWRQDKEYLLNVGLDLNNRPDPHVMYFNMGNWESSTAPGVIMFRPFLYDGTTGIYDNPSETSLLQIYPNPASDQLWFKLPDASKGEEIHVSIYDTSGRLVHHSLLRSQPLDLSGYTPGIYFIRALAGNQSYYSKLLINP